ncbi:VOC family protein [Amphibacillus cookii]|uniref:VOC family protein n=1 Tax=Amphibacillus cookii TaxID=767787 RepID=UPI00195EF8B9|nr:putative 3-demethylubiquinone-9 3-methyltransferase (glyoxalase superfamily) [Amphibacillus cookii]
MTTVRPFLMFTGQAEEAMRLYVDSFDDAEINELQRYGHNEIGKIDKVQQAVFTIHGQTIICTDSIVEHQFDFTPSTSLFVECDSLEELERVYHKLITDGEILMPLDQYGFSEKFVWFNDRFGVSWQLNFSKKLQ